jgi:hypothetical protein
MIAQGSLNSRALLNTYLELLLYLSFNMTSSTNGYAHSWKGNVCFSFRLINKIGVVCFLRLFIINILKLKHIFKLKHIK